MCNRGYRSHCRDPVCIVRQALVQSFSASWTYSPLPTSLPGPKLAQMASLMITSGKIGANLDRGHAFEIGLIIYAIGSLTTALAPNLTVLIIG